MWSRPVTFGGGMTMTKRGEPAGPRGWKRPSASQCSYQRRSKCEGSNVLSSAFEDVARASAGACSVSSRGLSGMKKGLSEPFHITEPVGLLFDARLQLLDALLDHELRDVGDHFPRDLAHDLVGEAL